MKFKKSSSTVNISTRKSIIPLIGMAILSIVLLGATYIGLGHVFETETYYVLKADVPAKTLVTQEMVEAKEVSKGGAPNNSIRIDNIKKGEVYTSIPLLKGDVLSASNTGINVNSDALGIPNSWSVTTFDINEGDASGGNIQKGDYFDIIGIDDKNEAKYLYTDVLALKLGTTKPQTTVSDKVKQLNKENNYNIQLVCRLKKSQDSIQLLKNTNTLKLYFLREKLNIKTVNLMI